MSLLIRTTIIVFLLAVLLFSIFGFLATYEPMAASVQIRCRIVYGVLGTFGLVGTVWLARR